MTQMTHDQYIDALIDCYETGEPTDKPRSRWDLHCTVTSTVGGWRYDPWEVRGEEAAQRERDWASFEKAFAQEVGFTRGPRWRVGSPERVAESAFGAGDSGRQSGPFPDHVERSPA